MKNHDSGRGRLFRVLAAAAAVCLMLGLTAGCGGEQKPDTSGGTARTDGAFRETVRDLGEKTIKLASFWNEWQAGESASTVQQECAKTIEAIKKDYNCHIELVTLRDSYQQDINTAIASGIIYANILTLQTEHSSIFSSGNIAPVKDIAALDVAGNPWNATVGAVATRGGVQYGLGFIMPQQDSINRAVLTFNKELASQYGIEDLYQLVRDGQWTFDKFREISQQVVTRSNGKVYGLIDGYHCFGNMAHANGIELVKTENGRLVFNGTSEPVLNALQFMQDYNRAGLLDMKDYVGNDYGLAEANVFMSRKTLFHMSDFWVVSQVFSSGMPDDYGVLPLPKGPDADKNVGVASNARYFSFIKGDPDIEDAAAVLVAIANRNAITGKEWIDRQAVDNLRDDESIEMLQIMLDNEVTMAMQMIMPLEYSMATQEVIYAMSKTPKQAMEEVAPVIQAHLDENYNRSTNG